MSLGNIGRLQGLHLESVEDHSLSRVPIVAPEDAVGEVRRGLMGRRFDSAVDVVVCEGERLVGMIRIEELLAAPADLRASDLMDTDPARVGPGTDRELAAWHAVRHGESSLAVVDEEGRFVGLVPPRRLLAVLLWEHDEDMARLSGFLRDTSSARLASEEPVERRFFHRLPWLLVGLVGALIAAAIVESFQGRLEANLVLAFFVPGIVYMADAVGTQTEAVVIRGLSIGIPIRRVIRREAITGLLVGLTIALLFFPVAAWRWGDGEVALTVSLSLFAACSTASLIAMLLPSALHRLGVDPAFGSGPLATVIQDLLSISVYFAIAAAVL